MPWLCTNGLKTKLTVNFQLKLEAPQALATCGRWPIDQQLGKEGKKQPTCSMTSQQ